MINYERKLILKAEHVDAYRNLRISVLMRFFQEVCIAHTEELGMGRNMTLDRGFLWIVNSENIQIERLPKYDEEIKIKSVDAEQGALRHPGGCPGTQCLRHA